MIYSLTTQNNIEYQIVSLFFTQGNQDLQTPGSRPGTPKGNSNYEILLVKFFKLKQKNKSNTSRY